MKVLKSNEYIYAMSTVARHQNPNFTIQVNPDIHRIGECYLKYYNSDDWDSATRVARVSLTGPYLIHHKNKDGKKSWDLNHTDKKSLDSFLREPSREIRNPKITNWIMTLYYWNSEFGFLNKEFPDSYYSKAEAFAEGFYDTSKNLKNKSYMPSWYEQPNYNLIYVS